MIRQVSRGNAPDFDEQNLDASTLRWCAAWLEERAEFYTAAALLDGREDQFSPAYKAVAAELRKRVRSLRARATRVERSDQRVDITPAGVAALTRARAGGAR